MTRAWFLVQYDNTTNISIASFVENVTNVGFNTTWNTAGIIDTWNTTFWAIVARGNGTVADGNQTIRNVGVVVDNSVPTTNLQWYTNDTKEK